jgi:hypothetical protein
MRPETLVDDVLIQWILIGGDFRQMLDDALAISSLDPEHRQRLREGGQVGFAQLQGADLDRLRRMKGNISRLRDELAAIMRW